jgi:uncharacterized protein involved in type VI secretion and phage assembly
MSRARQLFEIPLPSLFLGGQLAEEVSLRDEEHLNRVQIRLLSTDGVADQDGPIWARVAAPFAGDNRGAFFLPDVGDEVLVMFVQGDPRLPVIVGGLWNGEDTPPEQIQNGVNRKKVLRSRNGVQVTLDDQDGQETFIAETPGGQKLTLKDGPGSVKIEDSNGNSLTFEASGIALQTSATMKFNAAQVEFSAGMITTDAAMSRFSGVVQSDIHQTTTIVATTYTPGAGNIW